MNRNTAYHFGALLSLHNAGLLKKAAPSANPTWSSKLKGLYEDFLGRNVQKAMEAEKSKIMGLPFVKIKALQNPGKLDTFEGYVTKALKDREKHLPNVSDLEVEKVPMIQQQLFDALKAGNKEVWKHRKRMLAMRLGVGGALTAPVVGAALYKKSSAEDYAPAAAGIAAGAAPIAQGIASGALGLPESKKLRFSNIEEMRKVLKPGDILLTSSPGIYSFKALINATGADPYGFHVESVADVPPEGRPRYIHSTTGGHAGSGGASSYLEDLGEGYDYIVKRFKDPSHVEEYLKNLEERVAKEDILEEMLGSKARGRMYDMESALKAGAKSFLPGPLHRLITGETKPIPGRAVCSSLPGMASPVCLAPGIPRHEVLPHHIQHSPVLETVGHYRAPRNLRGHLVDTALRASPWLLRGALGAGLGYGAYKGLQALLD